MRRRQFLVAAALLAYGGPKEYGGPKAYGGPQAHPTVEYPKVVPGRRLRFPRDHGAHPEYRTEWWYATGWLERAGAPLGFQVTFFRARPSWRTENPSAFTPRQILLAHAAIADPRLGRLRHDQRAAREAFGLAGAETGRTEAWIDDWRIELKDAVYRTRIDSREFELQLEMAPPAAPVLQGNRGFSRKGPRPEEASYYYSRPHLAVQGRLDGAEVRGSAWLDHEWSSQYLAPEASGWDWCGLNLDGGESLMAFRIRAKAGGVYYAPEGVSFTPLRTWRSPRTGVEYPVAMRVVSEGKEYELEPLMDDQELDSRATAGTIYWEGAVRAKRSGKEVGRGYLELTGYWRPMEL